MPEINESAATLKKRMRCGETLLGVSVPMTTDRDGLLSIVERGPYDFVAIDIQHAPYDENLLVSFCQTAAEVGIHAQFRIKHTRFTYLIGNYLDLGPSGIRVNAISPSGTTRM